MQNVLGYRSRCNISEEEEEDVLACESETYERRKYLSLNLNIASMFLNTFFCFHYGLCIIIFT